MKVILNADDTATLLIYEPIGAGFFEGLSAKQFAQDLAAVGKRRVTARINSPGGNVWEGFAIYQQLAGHKPGVTVEVDGVAASAASVVAMAGRKITMAANSMMMIHDPYAMIVGGSEDLRAEADKLDKVKDQLVSTYAARTKAEPAQIAEWMKAETWMSAEEAKANGFADAVGDYSRAAASLVRPKWFTLPEAAAKRLETMPGPTEAELAASDEALRKIAALKL